MNNMDQLDSSKETSALVSALALKWLEYVRQRPCIRRRVTTAKYKLNMIIGRKFMKTKKLMDNWCQRSPFLQKDIYSAAKEDLGHSSEDNDELRRQQLKRKSSSSPSFNNTIQVFYEDDDFEHFNYDNNQFATWGCYYTDIPDIGSNLQPKKPHLNQIEMVLAFKVLPNGKTPPLINRCKTKVILKKGAIRVQMIQEPYNLMRPHSSITIPDESDHDASDSNYVFIHPVQVFQICNVAKWPLADLESIFYLVIYKDCD